MIVLSNGEKIQPLTMEETISTHPLVKSGLIVGQARFQSALIIESDGPVPETMLERENLINTIWPTVEIANLSAPTHAAISKYHIAIVGPDTFSRASKGTIQRFHTVRSLKVITDELYDQAAAKSLEGAPKYNLEQSGKLDCCSARDGQFHCWPRDPRG